MTLLIAFLLLYEFGYHWSMWVMATFVWFLHLKTHA